MASPLQASYIIDLRGNVISYSEPFLRHQVILDFSHCIDHLVISLYTTILSPLHLFLQTFPTLEGMLDLDIVLVQNASNTILANASPQSTPIYIE